MPLDSQPLCCMCKSNSSIMWRRNNESDVVCNTCSVRTGFSRSESMEGFSRTHNLRRNSRTKNSKSKYNVIPKNKSRRSVFKKNYIRTAASIFVPIIDRIVFYGGAYYQIGDIVSVVDIKGAVYYAQIRGLLQDQYGEKTAVLTWLLPTKGSPRNHFDPGSYILGPEEDIPRKLEYLEFVCHSPSAYYKAENISYPLGVVKQELGFTWAKGSPQIVPVPEKDNVFYVESTKSYFCSSYVSGLEKESKLETS